MGSGLDAIGDLLDSGGTSAFEEAFRAFRDYVAFTQAAINSFRAELRLQRLGYRIGYVVDYQEIYDYIEPRLPRHTSTSERFARFATANRFFGELQEPVLFPLGSIAELEVFLDRVRASIPRLQAAAQTTDVGTAHSHLATLFRGESDAPSAPLLPESGTLLESHRVAVSTLAGYVRGLEKLVAFFQSELLSSTTRDVADEQVFLDLAALQGNVRRLEDLRVHGRTSDANRADAFNITYADALNQHYLSRASDRTRDRSTTRYLFKVLTDTSTLFRASKTLELQLTYTNVAGNRFSLLERADLALYKRGLRQLWGEESSTSVTDLYQAACEADAVINYLDLRTLREPDFGTALFQTLLRPSGRRDFQRMKEWFPKIGTLRKFVVLERKLSSTLMQSRAANEVLSSGAVHMSSDQAIATLHAQRAAQTIEAIYSLLESIDVLRRQRNEYQRDYRRDDWSPPLQLQAYRHVLKEHQSSDRSEWRVCWADQEQTPLVSLAVTARTVSATWPTVLSVHRQLTLLRLLSAREGARWLWLKAISPKGTETLVEGEQANSWQPPPNTTIALLRVVTDRFTYISELWTAAESYVLATTVICDRSHDSSAARAVSRRLYELSQLTVLPLEVLDDEFWKHFPTDAVAQEVQC